MKTIQNGQVGNISALDTNEALPTTSTDKNTDKVIEDDPLVIFFSFINLVEDNTR